MATEAPEATEAPVAPAAPATRALSCPACGGSITIRAAGYTVTVACQYCGSILDVAKPEVELITRYEEAVAELEIPLGTRGTLRGVEYEVIGFMRRSEHGGYPWEEYLLFNPYQGYRWLVTNGRGWSLGEMLTRSPDWHNFGVFLHGLQYQAFFADGQAQVDYVLGEFYWRVKVGEQVATDDYVRPRFMLSREANEQEVAWTLSELLDPKEIEAAFGVTAPRNPWPPLPHQPSPYSKTLKTGFKIALGALAFLLLLTALFSGGPTLLQRIVPLSLAGQNQNVTLGPIVLTRPYQLVSIRASAPRIENAWVDIDYALVNRATQASYEAYGIAERYSGSDSDGLWTEGSRQATTKLAAVPAGTYDLVLDYSGNRWSGGSSSSYTYQSSYSSDGKSGAGGFDGPSEDLNIEVDYASVFPGNFILALILILLPLLFFFWRHIKFEKARQSESDVGPSGMAAMFQESDDDEEE